MGTDWLWRTRSAPAKLLGTSANTTASVTPGSRVVVQSLAVPVNRTDVGMGAASSAVLVTVASSTTNRHSGASVVMIHGSVVVTSTERGVITRAPVS